MARLTYKQRKKMSKKSFVFPGRKNKKNPAGKGAYPIPDKSHARAALSMVAQHGTPAEMAAVRKKVHAKYPNMGKEHDKKHKRGKKKGAQKDKNYMMM